MFTCTNVNMNEDATDVLALDCQVCFALELKNELMERCTLAFVLSSYIHLWAFLIWRCIMPHYVLCTQEYNVRMYCIVLQSC
jgi:hypothetical protein